MHVRHYWESQKGKRHSEGQDIRGWIMDFGDVGVVDWIDLAQNGDQSKAIVNVVMNFRVS
jgi:hypothetical protein